ncbi:MAG: tetratricopeptide repeat protein [Gemmatimonadales bacterium]|nr:tetratricopeptide repeat protein [Gemmatimonadales bacterium]NIN10455.1 tetratricopeptide repeat protein [Gemmatimonadales bacterium]NIN49247.1 tetratricopeptide repeat protein [Gemmatimonadales bacterium]NIP06711.1 tetratricopeptide repeat protein [Gemmatimonadales bacterium]NIR00042.1 tetratricopeptide repeat protein [Gemmatimonadales bacterium]
MPVYARAESLLSAGRLKEARALLESALRAQRDDPRALTLLGRVHLAWPVIGRLKAWRLFEQAARLDPSTPEPRYWQAQVGLHLGGADGERMIRDALYHSWELDPAYRDTWDIWQQIYRNKGHIRRAVSILSRHAGNAKADLRRAHLLIELGENDAAEAILADLIAAGRDDASVWALRAQGALEAGDTAVGLAHYERALARSGDDPLRLLWKQVEPIASPEEDSVYAATPSSEREGFFQAFWARREPDLTTAPNERIVEHFTRLRRARHLYRLLHPQSIFHRSPERRTLVAVMAPRVLKAVREFSHPLAGPVPGRSRFEDEIQAAGLGVDVRDVPEPDSLTRYRRLGFDGRGLLYLRFGEPRHRLVDIGNVEVWEYVVHGQPVAITLARASIAARFGETGALSGGDVVIFPTSKVELHNSAVMLERDETSIEAELEVRAWVAAFRGERPGEHLVYMRATPDSGVAAAWDASWTELARDRGTGPHIFRLAAGEYHLGLDVRSGDRLGRLRGEYSVPSLWTSQLAVSSILAGVTADTAFGRDDIAAAMPGDLRLPAGSPLALYAEIYDLPANADGMATYEVRYAFEPVGRGRAVALSFVRQVRAAPSVAERIVVQPGDVPPGRYRIVVTVRDRIIGREVQSTLLNFELR